MEKDSRLGDFARFVKPHWTREELGNLSVVAGFMKCLKDKAFDRLLSDYGDHPYLQHNPSMENGIEGVLKEVQQLEKVCPDYLVETKHVYVDGEFVIVQAHFTTEKIHRGDDEKGLNFIDIWKIVGGKIVEHWDSIQALEGIAVNNSNGRF